MDDYYSDNQPRLIHCKFCGEDYAATYKACPFCHTAPNGKKVGSRSGRNSRAGNRVRTNTRGGGYGGARSPLSIIGIILSIVLLVAAVVIVVVLVRSVLSGNDTPATNSSANITSSQQADGSGEPGAASQSSQSAEPQTVAPDSVSLDQTSATLNSGETVTLTATVAPSGWVGQVIWTTSDGNVATVDSAGLVSYVNAGTCTITASAGGITASCEITCNAADATQDPGTDAGTTGTSSIVVTAFGNTMDGDFTLNLGDTVPFRATGGDGANYTWTIEDPSIASVDPTTGSCTALADGKTTMTVTSGGESTTVTIRVNG